MSGRALIYLGSLLVIAWGAAHLVPTKSVLRGFGSIGRDNTNIVLMEWIVEGVALIFAGTLVAVVTAVDPTAIVSGAVYGLTAAFLLVMAIVSLFTGFKVDFPPFRLCPFVFTSAAVLITLGWLTA